MKQRQYRIIVLYEYQIFNMYVWVANNDSRQEVIIKKEYYCSLLIPLNEINITHEQFYGCDCDNKQYLGQRVPGHGTAASRHSVRARRGP